MNNYKSRKHKLNIRLRFIIPSLIGVLLFMCPIKVNGKITIPIAVLSQGLQDICGDFLPILLLILTGISFFGSVIVGACLRFGSVQFNENIRKKKIIMSLFHIKKLSMFVRGLAFVLCLLTYYNVGFEAIYSMDTGGLVFHDLLPVLFAVFLLAGFLLPLLLNFGLLEFAGTLLIKVMRPLFKLPGRSAIDAIASWLGDGTIGVMLTSRQYEEGYYTEREACVIGTSFSLVSITFCLVVINQVGLSDMFVPFYLTVCFACLVAAIILPKIPPLSRKKDVYISGKPADFDTELIPEGKSSLSFAFSQAINKVKDANVTKTIFKDGAENVLSMWIGVIPIVMAMGTAALIIATYTPFFRILGMPFMPLLKLLQIPEAAAVSETLFAGFADMLLPSIMIAGVKNDMARFIVAAVSVSQLIYLSEVGALIIASKIPIKLRELFMIFVARTIITLPIITLIAHLIF
ncbi:MAG: YjiH family protein [Clostridiales bacterium]|nr:YjiH family protein [Clostridiales bacterium]